jgi:selenocysteine lyase/cysteine desulfurase
LETELGGYAAQDSVQASGELQKIYRDIARLIHAKTYTEIALVESATVGWTRAFYALVQQEEMKLRKERERHSTSKQRRIILMSEAEYAANVVAACQWAKDHWESNWTVLAIPSSIDEKHGLSTGMVDLKVLESMLSGTYQFKDTGGECIALHPQDIAIVCITHVPTNSGIINHVQSIGEQIAAFNQAQQQTEGNDARLIRYLVDACQSVGQLEINVQKIRCHFLVATGRKYLRAPRGTGFLFIDEELLAQGIMPSHVDHHGCPVLFVPSSKSYQDGVQLHQEAVLQFSPRETATRFEFWESSVANRLGLGEAVCYAMERGMPQIEHSILQLSNHFRNRLTTVPGVRIHHEKTTNCGIVTFQCLDSKALDVQKAMWERGFELSVVPATSTPMDSSKTQVPDLLRASLTYVNREEELDLFCSALASYMEEHQE